MQACTSPRRACRSRIVDCGVGLVDVRSLFACLTRTQWQSIWRYMREECVSVTINYLQVHSNTVIVKASMGRLTVTKRREKVMELRTYIR